MSFRSAFNSAFAPAFRSSYNADVGGNLWLLDQYSDAAAAYSLRRLSAGVSKVVRVRRESDNNERDFTAKEVSNGTLQNWTNAQVTPPLDVRELTATGRDGDVIEAAAAYSLRNLSDSYTGSVVEVRRPDGAVRSFTAAEVTDGTLTTWVLGDVASLVGDARYFNGVDNSVAASSLPSISASEDFSLSFYVVTGSDVNSIQGLIGNFRSSANRFQCSISGGYIVTSFYTTSYIRTKSVPIEANTSYFVEISQSGTTLSLTVNGVVGLAGSRSQSRPSRQFTVGCLASSSSYFTELNGIIYDVKVFDEPTFTSQVLAYTGLGTSTTAWQDTIGSNDGTESNGTTFTGQGFDGTVSKWYDQSGNDNHATQGTPASQPKIVSGGSLVAGGLDFDGVDDGLFTAGNFTDTLQSATIFALTQDDTTSGIASMVRIRPNGTFGAFDGLVWEKNSNRTYWASTLIEGDNGAVSAALSGQGTRNTSKNLNTLVYQQSRILAYENGALDATLNNVGSGSVPVGDVTLVDQLWLGQNFDDNNRPFNGTMSEVIVYFTDQSDNRTALEANIGEVYGIAGIPAYDNTVNGFVETWYDQSGNGNNATQLTAGSQPKIVNAGVYLEEVDFLNGTNTFLETTNSNLCNIPELSVFTVLEAHTASSRVNAFGCGAIVSGSTGYGGWSMHFNGYFDRGYFSTQRVGNGTVSDLTTPVVSGADILLSATANYPVASFYKDGQNVANKTDMLQPNNGNALRRRFRIGCQYASSAISYYSKPIKEIILYTSDQSANREAIEANINNQYDIY